MNTEARGWLIPLPDIVPLDVRFGTRVVDKDKQGNTSSGGQSEIYVDSMTGWRQYGMDTPPSATVQPRSHVVLSLKMASTSNVGVYVATQVGGGQGDRKLDNSRAATVLCEDKSVGTKDYRSSQVDTASEKTEHLRACRHISLVSVTKEMGMLLQFCNTWFSVHVTFHRVSEITTLRILVGETSGPRFLQLTAFREIRID